MVKRTSNRNGKRRNQNRTRRANTNAGIVSINPAPLFRQLQTTHLHKATSQIYLVSASDGTIILYSDLAGGLISCPNFKQLSYVYSRYRIEGIHFNIMNLSPLQGSGATPLYVRYAPAINENPVSQEQISDTTGMKVFNPNKITMSSWCFKPRFSGNITDPAQPTALPDQDGFLPFSQNSNGFIEPFIGCTQYWQDVSGSIGEKEWQITLTYFLRCAFSV